MNEKTQFTWIIRNFKDSISENDSAKSLNFNVKNFPNKSLFLIIGKYPLDDDFLRLFACSDSEHEECLFNFTMSVSIINSSNQTLPLLQITKHSEYLVDKLHLLGTIENSYLLKFLVNDDLNLFFEMDATLAVKPENATTENPESEENKVFSFMNVKTFSDVTLQVMKKEIFAHKVILATKSGFFYDTFVDDNLVSEVKITNVRYDVLIEVLRFFYTGKIENLVELGLDVMKAAYFYQIDDLMGICENAMVLNVNSENVMEFLIRADECEAHKLKNACLTLIQCNFEKFRNSTKLEQLSKSHAHLLLEIVKGLPIQTNISNEN